MEENVVIYVAGNPDGYPLEYYDRDSGTYQGVIPQLLRRFSDQSRYEVIYYPTDGADRREHLAENLQVDLLSGYREGDDLPPRTGEIALFQTTYEGREQICFLCLTQAAPPSLEQDLTDFFAGVSQAEISGILLETGTPPASGVGIPLLTGGLALAAVLLAAALILTVRRYRKRLRRTEESGERDEVTGLGNFDHLQRYYRQLINDRNRILYSVFCFYVDTDRLRRLGGSREADAFLRYCAVVLQEYAADTDILAKISDQSFVLLKYAGNPEAIQGWLRPLLDRIRGYAREQGTPFEVNMTAGIYPLKAGDRDLNEMIFYASQAAHEAGDRQEEFLLCTSGMQRKIAEERLLQSSIDQALETRAFQLYLQFYVDAHTFRVIGGEALSRWKHPQKGLLTPGAFVPLLEREGSIYKLDYYCLREACVFLDDLSRSGMEHFFISCNFSRETFAAEDFAARCKEIMEPYCFPRELLIFELTESAAGHHAAQIRQNMAELKAFGVSLALDDFGVGFTSFADLQQYPVDGLKLDKGLVDNMMTDSGIAILRAMVQVGHELGITILAEGVETDLQVQMLQDTHCDVIQGFRFHAPVPALEARAQLLEQLRRERSGRPAGERQTQSYSAGPL